MRRWAETCKDIDLIATAERPDRARRAPGRELAGRGRGEPRPQRGSGADPQRDLGRPADRRPRGLRQPAPALHRVGRPTTCGCARSGELAASRSPSTASPRSRPARSSSTRPRREVYERLGYDYVEPELREGRGELEGGARGGAAGAGRRRRHPRRPPLATRPSPTGATRSRRWPRPGAPAATPTWRSPTTRPATDSATTSPPSASGSGSRRSANWNKGKRGFRLLAGSEVNIGLDGALDYPDDLLGRARLGRSPASTPPSRSPRRR